MRALRHLQRDEHGLAARGRAPRRSSIGLGVTGADAVRDGPRRRPRGRRQGRRRSSTARGSSTRAATCAGVLAAARSPARLARRGARWIRRRIRRRGGGVAGSRATVVGALFASVGLAARAPAARRAPRDWARCAGWPSCSLRPFGEWDARLERRASTAGCRWRTRSRSSRRRAALRRAGAPPVLGGFALGTAASCCSSRFARRRHPVGALDDAALAGRERGAVPLVRARRARQARESELVTRAGASLDGAMSLKIDQDHSRFRNIVRGTHPAEPAEVHLAGRADRTEGEGSGLDPHPADRHPALPLRRQAAGRRRAGRRRSGRSGRRRAGRGAGRRQAGGRRAPASTSLEVDVTLDELAAILGEELELPDIHDKGKSKIINAKDRYTGIRRVGPESLRHFRRTYREALKRQIAMGTVRRRTSRSSSPSPTTSATAAGRRRPSPSPTPSSST